MAIPRVRTAIPIPSMAWAHGNQIAKIIGALLLQDEER